ncbi:radial spoke head 1 homolog [Polyergus mexicanus]|uniref:radial spoke head 1 homolog n=1 Tax=Polyergus mexicanus TaxID=615972 RepID=UPI0038B5230E
MEELSDRHPDEHGETEIEPIGVYEGERNENGERHGNGKALLPNGDLYVGQYRDGLRYGKGVYVFKNGARYNGDWRHGCKYGQGIFWYPDGTRYEGEWKRDARHGFGVYYYANNDIYEGSWKKNLRHGMGTYLYANIETKFMGTWVDDYMQGPGQLVYERHRFHGFWKSNLKGDGDKAAMIEEPFSPRGILPIWRARCITPYNPELLPPEAVPLQEEASTESLIDKSEDDIWPKIEQDLDYAEGDHEEYYQEEASFRIDSP